MQLEKAENRNLAVKSILSNSSDAASGSINSTRLSRSNLSDLGYLEFP